jgi:hypothetical protein
MNQVRFAVTLLTVLLLFSAGCDKGLGPPDSPSGFSGVIRFKHWPASADSVQELRLIAFQTYPSDSASILLDLLHGDAIAYPQIGQPNLLNDTTVWSWPSLKQVRNADSIRYAFTTAGTTLKVGVYSYVALAWRYGPNVFVDWAPAGVYSTGPGPFDPAPVRVLLHQIITGIDLTADFAHPPPKPWQ